MHLRYIPLFSLNIYHGIPTQRTDGYHTIKKKEKIFYECTNVTLLAHPRRLVSTKLTPIIDKVAFYPKFDI